MAKTLPVSLRLEPALNDQVAARALALCRPTSWVIARAVEDDIALQTWQHAATEAGLCQVDAGRPRRHAPTV